MPSEMNASYPISASQIKDLQCLRYFYHKRLDEAYKNLPEAYSPPLIRGRDVHKLIEQYQLHLKATKQETDFEHMKELLAQYRCGDAEIEADVRMLCMNFAYETIIDHQHTNIEWPMAIQQKGDDYAYCKYDAPEARFRRLADSITINNQGVIVDDTKTAFYVPPESELADDPQTDISAAIALVCMRNYDAVTVRYRYIRYGAAVRSIKVTRWELADRLRRLEAQRERRNEALALFDGGTPASKAFPTRACELCAYCHYPCDVKWALQKRDIAPMPTTPEEAGNLADFIHIVQAGLDQAKDMLKKWCLENGQAKGEGGTYGFKPQVTREYGMHWYLGNWRRLDALGISPADLNVSGIGKKLQPRKKDDDFVRREKEELLAAAKLITKTTFGGIKDNGIVDDNA